MMVVLYFLKGTDNMPRCIRYILLGFFLIILCSMAHSQSSSQDYQIPLLTPNEGGGSASSQNYQIQINVGQPAGGHTSSPNYTIDLGSPPPNMPICINCACGKKGCKCNSNTTCTYASLNCSHTIVACNQCCSCNKCKPATNTCGNPPCAGCLGQNCDTMTFCRWGNNGQNCRLGIAQCGCGGAHCGCSTQCASYITYQNTAFTWECGWKQGDGSGLHNGCSCGGSTCSCCKKLCGTCVRTRTNVTLSMDNADVTNQTINKIYPFCGDDVTASGGSVDGTSQIITVPWPSTFPSGFADSGNHWLYHINPAGYEKYMALSNSYTLTATVIGTNACGFTVPSKSASVTITIGPDDNSVKLTLNKYAGTSDPDFNDASQRIVNNDSPGCSVSHCTYTDYPLCLDLSKDVSVSYTITEIQCPNGWVDATGWYTNVTPDDIFPLQGNIKVVSQLWGPDITGAPVRAAGVENSDNPSNPNIILISGAPGAVLAHEYGHSQGAKHNYKSNNYIMYPYYGQAGGTYNYIDYNEFSGGANGELY